VIVDTLSSAYPLTKKLLGDTDFIKLCDEFFANHACQESQVFRMTRELVEYISTKPNHNLHSRFPFLLELMEFEWTEMEMYMMEDIKAPEFKQKGNYLTDKIVLNPEHQLIQFEFPVFKKKPNELSEKDRDRYFCYAFRQPESGKIIFLDVSPVIATILSLIESGQSLSYIFEYLAEQKVILNESQKNSVVSFLLAEGANGMIFGFSK
jgi:hypothetical protein